MLLPPEALQFCYTVAPERHTLVEVPGEHGLFCASVMGHSHGGGNRANADWVLDIRLTYEPIAEPAWRTQRSESNLSFGTLWPRLSSFVIGVRYQ